MKSFSIALSRLIFTVVLTLSCSLCSGAQQAGYIYAFAGQDNNHYGYSGDGGSATAALLKSPFSVRVGPDGRIFIADTYNHRIRVVSGGTITTLAGIDNGGYGGYNGDGIAASSARLSFPSGLAFDSHGNLYISDSGNNRVRMITASNGVVSGSSTISTLAGTGSGAYGSGYFCGDGGQAANACLNYPQGLTVSPAGNVDIADTYNQRIREVNSSTGIITTIAGNGYQSGNNITGGFSGDGGPATAAELSEPWAIVYDPNGNLVISDSDNRVLRTVSASSGIINTTAGTPSTPGQPSNAGDGGAATSALFDFVTDVIYDANGNIFLSDEGLSEVRKIDGGSGVITKIAGYYSGNQTGGYNGNGIPATSAYLFSPGGVAFDSQGNLYIADVGNNSVRQVYNVSPPPPPPSTGWIADAQTGTYPCGGQTGPQVFFLNKKPSATFTIYSQYYGQGNNPYYNFSYSISDVNGVIASGSISQYNQITTNITATRPPNGRPSLSMSGYVTVSGCSGASFNYNGPFQPQ